MSICVNATITITSKLRSIHVIHNTYQVLHLPEYHAFSVLKRFTETRSWIKPTKMWWYYINCQIIGIDVNSPLDYWKDALWSEWVGSTCLDKVLLSKNHTKVLHIYYQPQVGDICSVTIFHAVSAKCCNHLKLFSLHFLSFTKKRHLTQQKGALF